MYTEFCHYKTLSMFFNALRRFPLYALPRKSVVLARGPMTASITKLPVTVSLRCSSCGAPGTGSCHCGAGYLPAGEHAAKMAKEHPELSSRELAEQTGVSQRTAARALQTAREPFGSRKSVVIGRDGRSFPATKQQPLRIAGGRR